MADADGRVVFEYTADTSGIDKANSEALGKLQGLGAKMLSAIGYAAIAKAAIDTIKTTVQIGASFESAFAGVIKTVDATEEELAELRAGILDMSKDLPASANEIAGVAEAAGQLGIQTENVLGFTRAMIDLGESTNLTADQAATQLARFANIMQMPQTEFQRLGSTIVDLGNNSATTEAEIVSMSLRIAGAGKQARMTEADIMGIAASLSSLGIEAEAGGTAISKIITDINIAVQTGSAALEDYAYVAGMSASQFRAAFEDDAAYALSQFVEGLGTLDQRGTSAILMLEEMGIAEIRQRDALLRASGANDLMTKSIERGNEAWKENTALTTEAAKRYETTESRFKMMENKVKDLAVRFFEGLSPALDDTIEGLDGVLDRLASDGTIDSFAAATGSLVSTLGDLVVVLGNLSAVLGPVSVALAMVIDSVNLLIDALGVLWNWLGSIFYIWHKELGPAYATKMWQYGQNIVDRVSSGGATGQAISSLTRSSSSQSSRTQTQESPESSQFTNDYQREQAFYAEWGFYPSNSDMWRFLSAEDLSDIAARYGYFPNARGTSWWRGGWTLVGEEGPELAKLPAGTQIYPANVSAQMMASTQFGGSTNVGAINVYPDSATYSKIIALLESSARARQDSRAGGYR